MKKLTIYLFSLVLISFLDDAKCIIGGRYPKLHELKYVVAVKYNGKVCGGAIMGDKHILTAAHCFQVNLKNNTLLRPLKVLANSNTTGYYSKQSIERDVRRAFIPKSRFTDKEISDIAVLELKSSLELKKNADKLQKLELPKPWRKNPITYPSYDNRNVKFGGYGDTNFKYVKNAQGKTILEPLNNSGTLHVVNATIIDRKTCAKPNRKIHDSHICVSASDNSNKTQGICFGDSGSPVVFDNKVVLGVSSTVINCDNSKNPARFTRTSSWIPFINNAMNGTVTADMAVFY